MTAVKSVFIAGLSSDIGAELAVRFLAAGTSVAGTYRNIPPTPTWPSGVKACRCDLLSNKDIASAAESFAESGNPAWDLFVSSVGTLEPIGRFFDVPMHEWLRSVELNCLRQLELLRVLYPLRSKTGTAHVAFFSGAGTNGPADAYSAYSASKIFLIKMCELLHSENEDLNCFIIGPGMVRTKIHAQTLQAGGRAGPNLNRIEDFWAGRTEGVSHEEVFACLSWCLQAGRDVVGGRNISLVGDSWRAEDGALAQKLRGHPDAFRLRRHSNDL